MIFTQLAVAKLDYIGALVGKVSDPASAELTGARTPTVLVLRRAVPAGRIG